MDTKLTLSFDAAVAEKAKAFAEANNISLSRLVEFMLRKVTDKRYRSLD
jgi:antitoxin component of RelBE/YafQ-DinJ toxin-antitoxin module